MFVRSREFSRFMRVALAGKINELKFWTFVALLLNFMLCNKYGNSKMSEGRFGCQTIVIFGLPVNFHYDQGIDMIRHIQY